VEVWGKRDCQPPRTPKLPRKRSEIEIRNRKEPFDSRSEEVERGLALTVREVGEEK